MRKQEKNQLQNSIFTHKRQDELNNKKINYINKKKTDCVKSELKRGEQDDVGK